MIERAAVIAALTDYRARLKYQGKIAKSEAVAYCIRIIGRL